MDLVKIVNCKRTTKTTGSTKDHIN